MARPQRHTLGCCDRVWCRSTRLPKHLSVSYLPRHIRSNHRPIFGSNQQPMVHQVRASSPVLILVPWPWLRPDHWRSCLVRLPAYRTGHRPCWMACHVHRSRSPNCHHWHLSHPVCARHPHASQVDDCDGKGCTSQARQRQPDGNQKHEVSLQGDH